MWNLMVSPGFTVLENSKIHNHAVGWECIGRGEGHCERSRESQPQLSLFEGSWLVLGRAHGHPHWAL